jgi:hypothetical protein
VTSLYVEDLISTIIFTSLVLNILLLILFKGGMGGAVIRFLEYGTCTIEMNQTTFFKKITESYYPKGGCLELIPVYKFNMG